MFLPVSTGRCTVNSLGLFRGTCFRGGLHKGLDSSSVSGADSGCGAPRRQRESQVVVDICGFCQLSLLFGDPSFSHSDHVVSVVCSLTPGMGK